jgi:transposase
LALLELQGRRLVRDRSQAIQRLRADWNQVDPVGEARALNLSRQGELRRRRRSSFAAGLVEQVASRCIRELARESQDLNRRSASLDAEIAQLLAQHGKPSADLQGAGTQIAAAVIAHAGDLGRFRKPAACARCCGAAPLPCGSGQTAGRHRRHRGGNR